MVGVFLIIAIIILIIFLIFYFNNKRVIIRTLSKIPLGRIGNLKSNGIVKFAGKALHIKQPLIAPYSKRECIFYTIKIEQRVKTGKSSSWKTLVKEENVQEFFLEVNGEYVIVKPSQNPQNYISYLVFDKKQRSGIFNEPSKEFMAVLNSYGVKSENFLGFNKSLRYREGVIEIGEIITVAGIAKWKSLAEPIPEYPYSKIVTLESSTDQKLIITDLPEVQATDKK